MTKEEIDELISDLLNFDKSAIYSSRFSTGHLRAWGIEDHKTITKWVEKLSKLLDES